MNDDERKRSWFDKNDSEEKMWTYFVKGKTSSVIYPSVLIYQWYQTNTLLKRSDYLCYVKVSIPVEVSRKAWSFLEESQTNIYFRDVFCDFAPIGVSA